MPFTILQEKINDRGMKKSVIAKKLGISERALQRKINGISPFSWEQVCTSQEQFFPDLEVKYLFSRKAG